MKPARLPPSISSTPRVGADRAASVMYVGTGSGARGRADPRSRHQPPHQRGPPGRAAPRPPRARRAAAASRSWRPRAARRMPVPASGRSGDGGAGATRSGKPSHSGCGAWPRGSSWWPASRAIAPRATASTTQAGSTAVRVSGRASATTAASTTPTLSHPGGAPSPGRPRARPPPGRARAVSRGPGSPASNSQDASPGGPGRHGPGQQQHQGGDAAGWTTPARPRPWRCGPGAPTASATAATTQGEQPGERRRRRPAARASSAVRQAARRRRSVVARAEEQRGVREPGQTPACRRPCRAGPAAPRR